jgi:hypothetical protein
MLYQRLRGRHLPEAQVRPVIVVVGDVLAEQPRKVPFGRARGRVRGARDTRCRSSARRRRSATGFGMRCAPAWYRRTSLSRRRTPRRSSPDRRSGDSGRCLRGNVSRSRWMTHAAAGRSVNSNRRTRLRPCSIANQTYKILKITVGTGEKSDSPGASPRAPKREACRML